MNPQRWTTWLIFAMTIVMTSSMDIYVPILPKLGQVFGVGDATIKLTLLLGPLASCLVGLPFGVFSDRRGRRPMLLVGIIVYVLGSAICAVADSIDVFFIGRFLQSLGVGGLGVLASACLADLYQGAHLAKFMGIYASLFPLTFALAPVFGAQIDLWMGWRAIFWTLTVAMAVLFVGFYFWVPESHLEKGGQQGGLVSNLASLARSRRMQLLALTHSLPMTVGAIFAVNGPFLYGEVFHFDPVWFSLILASPVLTQTLGAWVYQAVVTRVGVPNCLRVGLVTALTYSGLAILMLTHVLPLGPYGFAAILCLFAAGVTFLTSSTGALMLDGAAVGRGLVGSFMILARNATLAVVVSLASLVPHETAEPLLSVMLVVALCIALLTKAALKPRTY